MKYSILFKAPAKRQMDRLDHSIKLRVLKSLERLSLSPRLGKHLQGQLAKYWSLRIGDWRLIYEIIDQKIVIVVVAVGHRREVYEAMRSIWKMQ